MIGYIKNRSDFKTTQLLNVLTYDLAYFSTKDDTGTLTVEGEITSGEGSFLLFDGNLWVIDSLTPEDNITTIKTVNILSAFDRDLIYTESTQTAAARIASTFTNEYKSVTDSVYAMPYLTIVNNASGECAPDVKDGLWNLKSYIRKVHRLQGIRVRFDAGDALTVTIENHSQDRTILFGGGHDELTSQSYSKSSVAKITTLYTDSDTSAQTVTDWYLDADGNVSQTVPQDRADGEWKVMTVSTTGDELTETVTDEFAKNSKSHKIEWMSDRDYDLRDTVTTKLNGKVLKTYISYKGKTSTDSRWKYKSGELATTLTEILAEEDE